MLQANYVPFSKHHAFHGAAKVWNLSIELY